MPIYHVYADANVFLDFFRFSDDDLGELQKFADHINSENIILYLPQLTLEEYFRNRDKVVLDQLQELKRHPLKVGIPIFIRDLEKARTFQARLTEALAARNELLEEVEATAARSFRADELINAIFSKARAIDTTSYLLDKARERLSLGNPPGKSGALGDRLNWEGLLSEVPTGNDLYLLTRDGDYISSFPATVASMFLSEEWTREKQGKICLYKGIRAFAKFVDDTLVFLSEDENPFPLDPERTSAIENLAASFCFSQSDEAIANLAPYMDQFSPSDLEDLLTIAMNNGQVGGIISDSDLENFYFKVRNKMPWVGNAVADKFDEVFGTIVPF